MSIVFLGAGASETFGIPTMMQMVEHLEKELDVQHRELYKNIKFHLENYKNFDIEALITVLQHLVDPRSVMDNILAHPSIHYFVPEVGLGWKQRINYISGTSKSLREKASQLLKTVKGFVRKKCAHVAPSERFSIWDDFFNIIRTGLRTSIKPLKPGEVGYAISCEIFTTNYDLVPEQYCLERKLAFTNGEVGRDVVLDRRNTDLFGKAADRFRIRKLHGSVNWYIDKKGHIKASDIPLEVGHVTAYGNEVEQEMLIYPARELYTFREPFYDLFHNLKEYLVNETKCYVVGYSFRDDDIRGLFFDAIHRNRNLHVCLIDPASDEIVADRLEEVRSNVYQVPYPLGSSAWLGLEEFSSR